MTNMLNVDIWDNVAEALWDDATALCACTLTNSLVRGSMQRRLFHTVTMSQEPFACVERLLEALSARPSLGSYVRRLELHGERAWTAIADFVRATPTGAPLRLPCAQELTLSGVGVQDDDLVGCFAGCFPVLSALELEVCYVPWQTCIPTVFPALHTLHLRDCPLFDEGVPAPQYHAVKRLSLRSFSYTGSLCVCSPFCMDRFLGHGFSLGLVTCLGIHAEVALSVWPFLRNTRTRLEHLFIQSAHRRDLDIDFLHVPLPSSKTRSNTLLGGLRTLAVSIDHRRTWDHAAVLRSFATLVDSIPSPSLIRLTILLEHPQREWLQRLDWAPLLGAVRRLHWELSPDTRKAVRVAIQGDSEEAGLVPLVQSALRPLQDIADVEVVFGTRSDFSTASPVPHFAMDVYG